MRALLLTALAVLVGCLLPVLAGGGAAQAQTAPGPATFVYLDSDPTDPTGSGLTYVVPQTTTTMQVVGAKGGARLEITAHRGDTVFSFVLASSYPQHITTGEHRFGRQSGDDAFILSGPLGGCGYLHGTLDLRQLRFSPDGTRVTRLDLTFVARCDAASGRIRGEVAYRSTRRAAVPHDGAVLRGGQTLRSSAELLNAQGTDLGSTEGERWARAAVEDGQLQLLQRAWPDLNGFPGPLDYPVWSTPTQGSGADHLRLSTSGRLSLRTPDGAVVWSFRPAGAGKGTFLVVTDDDRLMLVSSRFVELWTTG